MNILNRIFFFLLAFIGMTDLSCNSPYTVKPKGYPRIAFPSHAYRLFDDPSYPYTFEYPVYAEVMRDSSFFRDEDTPYWINIDFPALNGKIYISYKSVGRTSLDRLVDDAYKMTYKHSQKATSIHDSVMRTPSGVSGVWFDVGGDVATSKQFFVTDSTRHFLRGALYFDASPNSDSLGIVYEFLQEDMKHLINTLHWR